MVSAAKLNVEFSSSGVGKVTNDVSSVGKALDSANGKSSGFFSNLMSTAGGFLIAGGLVQIKDNILGIGGAMITSNSNMEMWTKQLEVSTGSAEGANAVIKNMTQMAKISPFDLPQLIQSANALESLGFSSQKWMPIIGDTAAATGKSIDQVTQAVMDASTGEFERLKELGIRTKVNGDMIAFSFQKNGEWITVEAENTAEGIETALMGIWDDKYDGAMATMADTWTGRMGNLKDTVNMALMDMGKPLFDFMKKAVTGATNYLDIVRRHIESGNGVIFGLMWAIPEALRNMGLDGIAEMIVPAIKAVVTGWERAGSVGRSVGRVVQNTLGKAFEFLSKHMDVVTAVGKAMLTVFGAMMAWGAITAIVGALGAVIAALLSPIGLIIGAVALLYLAWDKNWFGIREKTAAAWAVLEPIFNWIKDAISFIVDGFEVGGWEEAWNRIKTVAGEAWDTIKDALSDVNWAAIWDGIRSAASAAIGWVVEQISSVNWSGFLSGAWGVIQNGLQLAWDAITSLNWGNFIPAIADLGAVLLQKIGSLPWGDYITAIGDFAGLVAGKIVSLPWGDYITAIEDFQALVRGKIQSLPWGDYITAIADFAALVGGKIKDLPWGDFLTAIADLGIYIAAALGTIVWDEIIVPIADFGAWLGGFLNNIEWPSLATITSTLTDWFGLLPEISWPSKDEILGALTFGLVGGSGDSETGGGGTSGDRNVTEGNPGSGGSSGFGDSSGGVTRTTRESDGGGKSMPSLPNLAGWVIATAAVDTYLKSLAALNPTSQQAAIDNNLMASSVLPVGVNMQTAGTQVGTAGAGIGSTFAGIAASALLNFTATQSTASAQMGALAANATAQAGTARANVVAQFASMSSGTLASSLGMQAGVAANMAVLQASVSSQASIARSNAVTQFSSMSAGVAGKFLGMQAQSAVQMAIMASTATTKGAATMSNLTSAIAGGMGRVYGALAGLVVAVASAGGSAASTAYSIGANISGSFASGMYAFMGQISAAAAQMVATASAALRAKAMIASPSKLFKRLGGYVGEGFELGIRDSIPDIARAADAMLNTGMPSPAFSAPFAGGGGGGATVIDNTTHNETFISLNDAQFAELLAAKDKTNAMYKHATSRSNPRPYEGSM